MATRALEVVHANGIVHRDLGPNNWVAGSIWFAADSVLTGLLANWELKEDTGDLVSASTDLESMVKTIASMTVPAYIYCAKRTSFVVDVTFSLVGGVLSHSIFNTLVLHEKIPKNRVKNLKGASVNLVPLDEKKKLDKYIKQFGADGYKIDYQLPELKNYGRVKEVPYTGLGTFCREVRGYLANGIYLDIDMVNCHPVVLFHLFKQEGLDTEIIGEYVNEREEFLKTEGITKVEFLKMINKEAYQGAGKVKKLHDQIYGAFLAKVMSDHPEIKVKRSDYNKKGQIIASYLQDIEFQMLSEIYKYGSNNGLLIDVLMHDGFFVRITDTIQLFKKMLGPKKVFESTDPSRDVWGGFNGQMANAFLVNLNELSKKDTFDSEGKIKGLITDAELIVNNKGVNAYSIDSFHRRQKKDLIIRSSEKCGQREYFNHLYEILEDQDTIKTCYEYFKSLPGLDKFGSLPIPTTEHQETLKEASISPIELWVKQLISDTKESKLELSPLDMYGMFKDYQATHGFKFEINSRQFAIKLGLMRIDGVVDGPRKHNVRHKVFEVSRIKSYYGM
ncbi:hypothetical protein BASA82_000004 [Batrachochytrium salamandrivorans]|nr:hypothetical protein BASA82_000004 [Batrachochytrium salamandrivorans]